MPPVPLHVVPFIMETPTLASAVCVRVMVVKEGFTPVRLPSEGAEAPQARFARGAFVANLDDM